VFLALHDAASRFRLSERHFHDLLTAFEQDVRQNRHADFESLLAYCRCSANPVGRLVLELFDHREAALFELSDCICTALQLANFWQDVAVDLARDRVYLPAQDLARFDLSIEDLLGFAASRAPVNDERWRGLMTFQVARTRDIFEQGRALPENVRPGLRRQLRLTWLGGMAILDRIERAGYDVFQRRPSLNSMDFLRLYLRARRGPLAAHPEVRTARHVTAVR
jgi:phytoene synthase